MERANGVRNRSADSGKSAENAKKMLFRGNEAKNTLKTNHLASSGAQNELFFEPRNPRSNPKINPRMTRLPTFAGFMEERENGATKSLQKLHQR